MRADFGVAGGDEEIEGAVDVGFVRAERVFDRAWNGGERSLVEDVIDAFAGGADSGDVLQVYLLEVDAVADVFEISEISGGKVIDAGDVVTLFDEGVGQGRADKSCDSGDEITGHLSSPQRDASWGIRSL